MNKLIIMLFIIGVLVTLLDARGGQNGNGNGKDQCPKKDNGNGKTKCPSNAEIDNGGGSCKPQPCLMTFNTPYINPESVEYSDLTGFLVTSLNTTVTGHIYQVSQQGVITSYVYDARILQTRGLSFGKFSLSGTMAIVSCNRPDNPTAQHRGGVAVISVGATQGELIRYIDITNVTTPTNSRFQDDLAINSCTGDIYLTEAKGGWIYKIPPEEKPPKITQPPFVWSNSTVWLPTTEPTGLNGIDYWDGKDYLLACHQGNDSNSNIVYKVPFDNPNKPIKVDLTGDTAACDGLNYVNEKTVIMSGNRVNTIYQIVSCDDWKSATVIRQGPALVVSGGLTTSTVVSSDNRYHALTNTNFDAATPVYIQNVDLFCNANGQRLNYCKVGELWNPTCKKTGNNNQNMEQVLEQMLEANSASTLTSFLF